MRRWLLASLLAVGCAETNERVFLNLEPAISDTAESAIIVVVDATAETVARAIAVEPPFDEPLEIEATDRILEITVVAYDRPLASLDLEAGALSFATTGRTRALPAGGTIFASSLTGLQLTGWTEVESLPAVVNRLRLPLACRTFISTVHLLDTPAPVIAMMPDGDGAVLAAATGWDQLAQLYRVTADDAVRIDEQVPNWAATFGTREIYAMERGSNGTIWMALGSGAPALLRGSLEQGFTPIQPRPIGSSRWTRWMVVMPEDDGTDVVYLQTDYGDLFRYREREDEWDAVAFDDDARPVRCGAPNGFCGGIHVVGDELLTPHPNGDGTIFSFSGGTMTEERVPNPELGHVAFLADSPFGLVAIRSDAGAASVFVRDQPEWTATRRLSTQQVMSAVRYDDSLLVSGVFGFVTELTDDGDCETAGGLAVVNDPGLMVRSGDDVFVVRGGDVFPPPDTRTTQVVVLELQ